MNIKQTQAHNQRSNIYDGLKKIIINSIRLMDYNKKILND